MSERRFGLWAGKPNGVAENTQHCVEAVWGDAWYDHQCSRKRGFGKAGLYCKQHAKRNPAEVKV